jgi:RNA polymerase sigma-70 factor (ECF subfamily)
MAASAQLSDRRLLGDARRGSREAIEALVERHWDRAHRIAYGLLGDAHAAEDVTQEAMLSVVGGIGRFDVLRPFEPWLHRVVTNRALDWARSRSRRPEVPVAPGDSGPLESRPEPGSGGDTGLEAALDELSEEQRAVVVLRYVGGYGPDEIGRMLGIPRGTVGSRLRRALDQLREEMEESDG